MTAPNVQMFLCTLSERKILIFFFLIKKKSGSKVWEVGALPPKWMRSFWGFGPVGLGNPSADFILQLEGFTLLGFWGLRLNPLGCGSPFSGCVPGFAAGVELRWPEELA